MDNPNGLLRRTCFIGVEEDVKDKETSARTAFNSAKTKMVVNTPRWPMTKRQKIILVVKIASPLTKEKQECTARKPQMTHLPVWSCMFRSSILNAQHFSNILDQIITLLSSTNIPDRHIMFVSGHSNEQSIAHYSSRPTPSQLENVSDTFSSALENLPSVNMERSLTTVSNSASVNTSITDATTNTSANVSLSMSSFPAGFFTSCNIGNVQVMLKITTTAQNRTIEFRSHSFNRLNNLNMFDVKPGLFILRFSG